MDIVRLIGLGVFLVIMGSAGSAAADSPSLTGTYLLDEEASDDMVESFEPAIEEMGRVRRGFARRAIEREDGPDHQVLINHSDDEISIQFGDEPVQRIPLNGQTVENKNSDGDTIEQSARVDGSQTVMVQTQSDKGVTATEYRLDTDTDKLEVAMELDFDQLPKKVDYRIVYDRQ